MKNIFYTLLLVLLFSSCSEYQKALKSEDIATKFNQGIEMYDAGKFNKANRLFAQIVPNYRGKPQAEKLMFLYSKSYYMMEDYYLSGYQFERFTNAYAKSEKVEEAAFLSAKSFYMLSPIYSKEQKETIEAIEKLQLFINKYSDSEYLPEANKMVKELDYKLEKKAFEIAKQYNKIAYYDASDYEAAIKAFDNFLVEYPGTSFREDAMFYRFDSAHHLALNSIETKKEVRLNTALSYFNSLKKAFADSNHMEEANNMNEELQLELQKIKTKS
ncbi:outer membrane protein assembly factor BamD [Flavobacteriales bacterium 34_180_T64]|nr:outer membrane protein assembly factor BamD [Flavobacteriales bacterium 34_180_T64]